LQGIFAAYTPFLAGFTTGFHGLVFCNVLVGLMQDIEILFKVRHNVHGPYGNCFIISVADIQCHEFRRYFSGEAYGQ
jgi:hypothetical protein